MITLLPGCAQHAAEPVASAAVDETNDPLEPVNREIFDFNQFLDRILLKPLAKGYVFVLPQDGRETVRHVLDNLKEPTVFFNNALQGEFERAGITVGRFAINTTVGLGGIMDVAKDVGLKRQPADFGQTLYAWGFPQGPYLVLPIFGPSNPRDAIGMGIDSYADPLSLLAKIHDFEELSIGRFVANGLDERARVLDILDDLQKNSLDFYAQLRSLSQQHRDAELRHGAPLNPGSNFYIDPDTSIPAPPAAAPPPSAPTPAPVTAPPVSVRPPLGLLDPGGEPLRSSARP
jgi:phospholipid-binding lipoprotein MlaA